jgi:acetyltransferase-like isoleucine patch superfamily enzyme
LKVAGGWFGELQMYVIQVLSWLFPWRLRRLILRGYCGFHLDAEATVGYSIIVADEVHLARGSAIGHLTIIRNLDRLVLGENAIIGNLNKIAGVRREPEGSFQDETTRSSELILGRHAAITNSHIIDCTNTVFVDEFATVAGWRSQILTHSIEIIENRQRSAAVNIGKYSFVGTGSIILKGAVLPERSILSAGSVLSKAESEPYSLYSGNPAVRIKKLDSGAKHFSREEGVVS